MMSPRAPDVSPRGRADWSKDRRSRPVTATRLWLRRVIGVAAIVLLTVLLLLIIWLIPPSAH